MSHIDTVHKELSEIGEVSYNLVTLAEAFLAVGNKTVAKRLYVAANQLDKSAKTIKESAGKDLDNQVKVAQRHAGALLEVATAGCFKEPSNPSK